MSKSTLWDRCVERQIGCGSLERGDFPDQLWQYLNDGHLIAWLGHIGYQESEESVDFLATPDRENLENEDISFDEED